jgi:uncharacterized protein
VKVFLDTNVLVSAFSTRGLAADVFRLVLAEHELLTGEVVLEEFERVLTQNFRVPPIEVAEILSFLREGLVEPRPATPAAVPISDPDDAWVLASALSAGAEVLVTGDLALLGLNAAIVELKIMNPRNFWDLHRGPRP